MMAWRIGGMAIGLISGIVAAAQGLYLTAVMQPCRPFCPDMTLSEGLSLYTLPLHNSGP